MPDQQPEELEAIRHAADQRLGRRPVSTVGLGGGRLTIWAVLIAIVVLTGGGFLVGRGTSGPSSLSTTTTTVTASVAQPVEVGRGSLVLGQGDAAAEWSFVVFDPTGRSLSVSVDDLSPPDTDLAIAVRVTDGRSLNLGRTTAEACDRGTVHAVCKLGPAGLEGTRAGTWVLRIEKNSQADARVSVTVRLNR